MMLVENPSQLIMCQDVRWWGAIWDMPVEDNPILLIVYQNVRLSPCFSACQDFQEQCILL